MLIATPYRKNAQRINRPLAGVVAANLLLVLTYVETSLAAKSAAYSIGWGLALLVGVRAKEIYSRHFRSSWKIDPSWSAALAFHLTWVVIATPFFFRAEWRSILDLSIYPFCLVYIGAKLGCLHIGCCDWGMRFKHMTNSWWRLPTLELTYNSAILLLLSVLLVQAPLGAKFLAFTLLHVIGWRFFKIFR